MQGYLGVLDDAIELGKRNGVLNAVVPTTVVRWAIFGAIDEISTTWVLTEVLGLRISTVYPSTS